MITVDRNRMISGLDCTVLWDWHDSIIKCMKSEDYGYAYVSIDHQNRKVSMTVVLRPGLFEEVHELDGNVYMFYISMSGFMSGILGLCESNPEFGKLPCVISSNIDEEELTDYFISMAR
jgi:hypothetical protein